MTDYLLENYNQEAWQYMLGEPTYMKYHAGGSVGHAPWHKPTGQACNPHLIWIHRRRMWRPDLIHSNAPRGLPSLAPKNMDPAYMQQQMMQKAMMGQGQGMMGQGPRPMANAGGRIGYKDKGSVKGPSPEEFWNDKNYNQMRKLMDEYERYKKNYEKDKQRRSGIQEAAEGGIMRMGFKKGGDMSKRIHETDSRASSPSGGGKIF